jgi:UDP-glucose 4-epimerase
MSQSVLITGVAGFLGRYTAREFLRAGWQVMGVDSAPPENAGVPPGVVYRQMRLPSPELQGLLASEVPGACVHCAGRASVPLSVQDPAADFTANTVLTFELLELLRRHAPACRFIFLSSAAVYGNAPVLPVHEEQQPAPLSPYGYHKLQSELICEEFQRVYGIPTAAARIFSAYGPGLRRQVIWDICTKLLLGNGELRLIGTGQESRDFIHAADVARALVSIAEKAPCEGERYNLGSGRETTIADLVDQITAALGREVRPVFDGKVRHGDPLNWRANIQRITQLGFNPTVPLEEGVRGVAAAARAELVTG